MDLDTLVTVMPVMIGALGLVHALLFVVDNLDMLRSNKDATE